MASLRRRRQSPSPLPQILLVVAIVLVAGGVGWYWYQSRGEPDPPPAAPADPSEVAPDPEEDPDVPPLELPELSASDEFVRTVVARLSEHPQLAEWLTNDELIHRFVLVVVDLAGESNPAANVEFMVPSEPFSVRESDGRLYIAPETHARFNLLAATFASLDTDGTVQLYRQLRPLIVEAYEELGIPDYSFDQMLEMAIRNLLAVEVPDEPIEVVAHEELYDFQDPELEARGGAEKALYRMGPENTRLVQAKLRELARELGIQP